MSTDAIWPPAYNGAIYSDNGCTTALTGKNKTYNVGTDKEYKELTDVPWLSLVAGDVVNVFYRDKPYATLIGLRAKGTADKPVTINGVTDSSCRRPVLTGANAVPATDAKTTRFSPYIQGSGIFQIYKGASDSLDTYRPSYISFKGLKLTGAREGNSYYDYDGKLQAYGKFTSGIYVIRVDHMLVENCEVTDNGLGIFVNSKGGSNIEFSANVTLRANKFDLNGYSTDDHEHNIYVQARRALYEGNFIGQARGGSSLKDRSSGTVVRYNMVVASARALDLVESEEEYTTNLQGDPLYNTAWVYGNVIVNDLSSPNGSSARLIHWGFDNTYSRARTGTLYFYNNTVVQRGSTWKTAVFQTEPVNTIEAWDNIFTSQGLINEPRFLWESGVLNLRGTNYAPTGWTATGSSGGTAVVNTTGSTLLVGSDSVVDASTFIPVAGASVLNKGGTYTPNYAAVSSIASDFSAANTAVQAEYYGNTTPIARVKVLNGAADIGALERR